MSASLLAIDSSTERLALALQWAGRAWTVEEEGGALASARIVPRVMALLAEAGTSLPQLQAIGIAQGPGAFTGLRTACAVAQGLAFGAGLPVLALDSLLIVAEDARAALPAGQPADPFDVWVAMDARMGEVYGGHYVFSQGEWTVQRPPALYDLGTLLRVWHGQAPRVVAGSALQAFGERLPTGDALRVSSVCSRAEALLSLAQAAWRQGRTLDPSEALPLYLRDKVALTTAEREAARAAEAAR